MLRARPITAAKALCARAMLALPLLASVPAAHAASVHFEPPDIAAAAGAAFDIKLVGQGFDVSVDGGGVSFAFDPAVVNVTAVAIDPFWDFFASVGTIDNSLATGGRVLDIVFNTLQDTMLLNPPGSFPIATIALRAMAVGATGLILSESAANPFASGGIPLVVEYENGSVRSVPQPPPWTLLLAALGLSLGGRKQFRAP